MKKVMLLSILVCCGNNSLFAMDDSVTRLLSMFADGGRQTVMVMDGLKFVVEPRDLDGNVITKIYKIHRDRPRVITEIVTSNGGRITHETHPETLTQKIVKLYDGSKQVTTYDENANVSTQKFDRNGNLVE